MIRLLFALLFVTTLHAESAIEISSRDLMGSAPKTVRVKISLPPDPANRWVCLYTNGNENRSSCWSVEGEKEALTTWRLVKDLSAGKWDIVAAVIRNDEKISPSNHLTIIATGFGYEPE